MKLQLGHYETAARPLIKDEFSILLDSIKEHGLRDPIVTNEKGVILDGHNRYRACQELGIELQPDDFIIKQFDKFIGGTALCS